MEYLDYLLSVTYISYILYDIHELGSAFILIPQKKKKKNSEHLWCCRWMEFAPSSPVDIALQSSA